LPAISLISTGWPAKLRCARKPRILIGSVQQRHSSRPASGAKSALRWSAATVAAARDQAEAKQAASEQDQAGRLGGSVRESRSRRRRPGRWTPSRRLGRRPIASRHRARCHEGAAATAAGLTDGGVVDAAAARRGLMGRCSSISLAWRSSANQPPAAR
jgi:hypothetical protein